ncbi:6-bladed beta-propeller, partial [Candidatus Nitrosopelagicus sp.]|nr:6-bladed beta-propeller [Candidatus Nitrosopelagicus sp.]
MHKEIFLIAMLSISLVGMTFVENSFADAGTQFHSTFGKHGISQPGFFLNPQSMAFDSENNLYITDLGNSRVQKFDSNGNFLFEWGSKGSIPGQFGYPTGIAISNESVFVVDNKNNNIQKFDLDGNFITYWGQYGKDSGSFNSPLGIITSQDNFVYVVDSGNARIQKFTLDGEFVDGFGRSSQRGGGFTTPVDIAINSDKLYVTDSGQGTINIYTLDGQFLGRINDSVGGFTIDPKGIVFDAYDNFYISDSKNNRVIQYNEFGVVQTVFGHLGINDAEFQYPQDVAISNDGYLFVTDTSGHRIQKFSTSLSDEYSLQNSNETQISEYEDNLDLNVANTLDSEKKSETIIPNDFKKPTIMVPDNIIIEASGPLTLVNIGDAMATDENGILSLAHNAPSSFPLGVNTIIWTAIDGAGNMAIGSQIVTIQDTTPPSISTLNDISREAKSPTENLVDVDIPLVTDDVGVLSITNDAPEVFPLGETIVTWTATDVMGNISTITQSVFLIDSMSPRIAYLDDLTIEAS